MPKANILIIGGEFIDSLGNKVKLTAEEVAKLYGFEPKSVRLIDPQNDQSVPQGHWIVLGVRPHSDYQSIREKLKI